MSKAARIAIGSVVLAVLIAGGCGVAKYNALVSANEEIDAAWAQVENVLQRRADLIPNLVNTVKGYAAHEKDIFSAVAEARSKLLAAKGPADAASAHAQMSSALGRLLAIAERYPDLKASANFTRLQDELAGTENRIAVERRRYNEAVKRYNTTIKRFPGNLFASLFGFEAREYFEAEATAKQVPKVEF
ncbi:MAG: LemA family protein [Deltaproteobacteria bacterium]|nr:MAG: LemA family protein [Deltaproteobacteria bacterium]